MIKILHKGLQPSMDIDVPPHSGVLTEDLASEYFLSLKAGRVIAQDEDGIMRLADGVPANGLEPVGFLINDIAGEFFNNKSNYASRKAAHTLGNVVLITDQIAEGIEFNPADKLYAGTGANKGLVTNVAPHADAKVIGVAASKASVANPNLKIYV